VTARQAEEFGSHPTIQTRVELGGIDGANEAIVKHDSAVMRLLSDNWKFIVHDTWPIMSKPH